MTVASRRMQHLLCLHLAARAGLLAAAMLVAACSTTPPPVVAVEKPLPPERQVPIGAAALLKERFPDLHVVANSSGPLLKPEVSNIAVVLAREEPPVDDVIALLEPAAHGAWDGSALADFGFDPTVLADTPADARPGPAVAAAARLSGS